MVCMGMHFIFKPYEIIPAGYDYDKGEYSSVYKSDKLQNLEASSWMAVVVTLYAGWITVIPKQGSVAEDGLWDTIMLGVTFLILIINAFFIAHAVWLYVLELSRESKLGVSFHACIHGCHRIHGKTKSKKARRKLKKMSSIVVPGGGSFRKTQMVAAQEEVNAITKLESRLLRFARKAFSPGSPEYARTAKLIIKVSRGDVDIVDGKSRLCAAFGDSNAEVSALIAQFVEKIEERDVKDGKVSSTTAVTDKPYTGDITDLFGNVLNETVVVDDAHTMDKKQQKHAASIRKEFKQRLRAEQDRKLSFDFDGSKERKKSVTKMLTEALKSKNYLKIKRICDDVESNKLAAETFANQLSILRDIVTEGQDKAMDELKLIVNAKNISLSRLQACLDKVALLECPQSDSLLKESMEVFIREEHFAKLRKLIDDIPFNALSSIGKIGEKVESVAVSVRAMLLLIGTPPKEIASFDKCIDEITVTGKTSIKSRVRELDLLALRSKKKTLKLVGKMLVKINVTDLQQSEAAQSFYGFVAGVMAELDHSYLVKNVATVDPKATLSWGNSKEEDNDEGTPGTSSLASESIEKKKKKPKLKRKGTMML